MGEASLFPSCISGVAVKDTIIFNINQDLANVCWTLVWQISAGQHTSLNSDKTD